MDNDRLVQALARFGSGVSLNLDRFGVVQITVVNNAVGLDTQRALYLFPTGQLMRTLSACATPGHALFSVSTADGSGGIAGLDLARWGAGDQPEILGALSPDQERVLLCWTAPPPLTLGTAE